MKKSMDEQMGLKFQKMVNINQKMVRLVICLDMFKRASIHQMMKRIDEPYTSTYRNVMKLAKLGVVEVRPEGKANYISVNLNNEMARHMLSIASLFKRQVLLAKHPLLKIIRKGFVFNAPLLVFGSYAKGAVRKKSDIDICVIGLGTQDKKDFKKHISQIEMIHQAEINCMFFKKREFTDMLKAKEHNVGKEILLNHIVLSNADLWYNLIAEVHDEVRV